MSEEKEKIHEFTPAMEEMIEDLLTKAFTVTEKTKEHSNCTLHINGVEMPIRVDDHQLLYIGCRLLPNIMNYLVNIVPQFLYPYVVAYLQDLSTMREDPIMINELYDYLSDV